MVDKVIKTKTIKNIKMPTKMFIGDNEFLSNNEKEMRNNENIFFKNFKSKDKWVGEAALKRIEIDSENNSQCADYLSIMFSAEESLLELYKNQTIYDYQKISSKELFSDSKDILLKFNNNELSVTINKSGLFADIVEIHGLVNKFEGLIINIYLGENNNFNELETLIDDFLITKSV